MAENKKEELLEYKGRPLIRSKNVIYYGSMADPYIVCLTVKNAVDYKDINLSDSVAIQLLSTDNDLSPKDRIIKKSEKKGLFNALDLGVVWLERALKNSK